MFTSKIDADRFETLIEINTLINSNYTEITPLLTRILNCATRLTGSESSSLLLLNSDNNRLYFEIAIGPKSSDIKKFSLNMGEGIAGWVAKNNTSLIVNDADSDHRFNSDISKRICYTTDSILAVPMRIKDTCVGVIEVINKLNKTPFQDDDLQWLEIFATQAAIAIQNAKSYQEVKDKVNKLQHQIESKNKFHKFIWKSKVIDEKLLIVDRMAPTNSPVFILGESGVGKELFAEQIHLRSNRKNSPFIRVNCASIPDNLIESELFGYVRGAFTGAVSDRRGRFELADEGTIFLDEIAEIPLHLQAKLLRVIQDHIFEKVGSSEPLKVDVRILAATNKNIDRLVEEGKFRKDLYYRLNVLPLHIPPLRERQDDIIELANYFLKSFENYNNIKVEDFSEDAIDALLSYQWPGNIRELENVIKRAVLICNESNISSENLFLDNKNKSLINCYENRSLKDAVNRFKSNFIKRTLDKNNWKQIETAKQLCIQRTYLSRLIKELEIKK